MKKAIAPHTLVIIGIMVISLVVGIIIFWQWIASTKLEASRTACLIKRANFCEQWVIKNQEPDWNKIPPIKGCEEFGVFKPNSKGECEQLG